MTTVYFAPDLEPPLVDGVVRDELLLRLSEDRNNDLRMLSGLHGFAACLSPFVSLSFDLSFSFLLGFDVDAAVSDDVGASVLDDITMLTVVVYEVAGSCFGSCCFDSCFGSCFGSCSGLLSSLVSLVVSLVTVTFRSLLTGATLCDTSPSLLPLLSVAVVN